MRRHPSLLLPALAALFVLTAAGAGLSAGENGEYAAFVRTALQKWDAYVREISRMECTQTVTAISEPDPEGKSETLFVTDFPKCLYEKIENGSVQAVRCYGKKYHFALTRNSETGKLEIETLEKNGKTPDFGLWKDFFFVSPVFNDEWGFFGGRVTAQYLGGALTLWGPFSLPQLFGFESFSIERLTEDEERFYVDYKFEPPEDGIPAPEAESHRSLVRSGHLVLRKDTYLPESADFMARLGGQSFHYVNTYEYGQVDGKTVLKSKRSETTGGDKGVITILDNNDIRFRKQPSSRFTLSHYGLSEPKFESALAGPVRLALVLLGGALVLYSLLRISRRRKNEQTEETER